VGPFRGDGAWLDKTFRQTSLMIEPANGRTPPLTPEAEQLLTTAGIDPTERAENVDQAGFRALADAWRASA